MRHDSHYVEELSQHRPQQVGRMVPVDKIDPNPEQPRTDIGDLTELTASIAEKGVLEPLLVKPNRLTGRWMIIAGERRWRSAQRAGLKEVPCVEMEVDDGTVAEIALIENMQRKDLTVWEEADGLLALCERFGYTHDDVARKVGKSRTTVTEALAIAKIPEDVRQVCRDAEISANTTGMGISGRFNGLSLEQPRTALVEPSISVCISRSCRGTCAHSAARSEACDWFSPHVDSRNRSRNRAKPRIHCFRGPAYANCRCCGKSQSGFSTAA